MVVALKEDLCIGRFLLTNEEGREAEARQVLFRCLFPNIESSVKIRRRTPTSGF